MVSSPVIFFFIFFFCRWSWIIFGTVTNGQRIAFNWIYSNSLSNSKIKLLIVCKKSLFWRNTFPVIKNDTNSMDFHFFHVCYKSKLQPFENLPKPSCYTALMKTLKCHGDDEVRFINYPAAVEWWWYFGRRKIPTIHFHHTDDARIVEWRKSNFTRVWQHGM